MLPFLFLFACLRFVLFVLLCFYAFMLLCFLFARNLSVKQNKGVGNCPNSLIHNTTSMNVNAVTTTLNLHFF